MFVIPIGAKDGDYYKAEVNGVFEGEQFYAGDHLLITTNATKVLVIPKGSVGTNNISNTLTTGGIAKEAIGAVVAVRSGADGFYILQDNVAGLSHECVGINTYACNIDETATVQVGGVMTTAQTWIAGMPLYVSANGTLTQDSNSITNVVFRVGVAVSPNAISIEIDQPINLI